MARLTLGNCGRGTAAHLLNKRCKGWPVPQQKGRAPCWQEVRALPVVGALRRCHELHSPSHELLHQRAMRPGSSFPTNGMPRTARCRSDSSDNFSSASEVRGYFLTRDVVHSQGRAWAKPMAEPHRKFRRKYSYRRNPCGRWI